MRAIGITCGIGSMLVGARQAGFEISGNVEWRKYYHEQDQQGRNTFKSNFPGADFVYNLDHMSQSEIEKFFGADLALGHPECGNFSRLSGANIKAGHDRRLDPADIPLFVDLVAKLKPRFFVMDDLPGSFAAFPMSEYAKRLPDYDLFPEWISNWGYGNVQKGRNRMFMLGALRSEGWVFFAGENEHTTTMRDILEDLPEPMAGSNYPNHDPHWQEADCFRALNLGGYRKMNTWAQVTEYFRDKRGGFTLEYPTKDGRMVKRIGFLKAHWDGPCHVLTGGNAILHHIRCTPLTIRERARVQGFPDDFVFYGTITNEKGEWNHEANQHMVRQTGKAMPVQFCRYVSKQIAAQINGQEFESSGRRVIPPNKDVSDAKMWYCDNVGYGKTQEKACEACWLKSKCPIRKRLFPVTEPVMKLPETAVSHEPIDDKPRFDSVNPPISEMPQRARDRQMQRTPKPAKVYASVVEQDFSSEDL